MEYGNPSGHSLIASNLAFGILFDMLEREKKRKYNRAPDIICSFLAILYVLLMGLSRVIIAAHTWNQVIFGWLLGLWTITFSQLLLKKNLYAFIDK